MPGIFFAFTADTATPFVGVEFLLKKVLKTHNQPYMAVWGIIDPLTHTHIPTQYQVSDTVFGQPPPRWLRA